MLQEILDVLYWLHGVFRLTYLWIKASRSPRQGPRTEAGTAAFSRAASITACRVLALALPSMLDWPDRMKTLIGPFGVSAARVAMETDNTMQRNKHAMVGFFRKPDGSP